MRDPDEWTIERLKTPSRLIALDASETQIEPAPPLWKDLTLASIVAVLLWLAAAVVFR